jgi:hypothetical protein
MGPRPDLALPDNRGRQSAKGYHRREVYPTLPISAICGPDLIGYSGSRGDANLLR